MSARRKKYTNITARKLWNEASHSRDEENQYIKVPCNKSVEGISSTQSENFGEFGARNSASCPRYQRKVMGNRNKYVRNQLAMKKKRRPKNFEGEFGVGNSASCTSYQRKVMGNRNKYVKNQLVVKKKRRPKNIVPSNILVVFGLSAYTQERKIKTMFSKYGPVEDVQVVYHGESGRSRGFSFVYFEDVNRAITAKRACNGLVIDGHVLRIEFASSRAPRPRTPGIYLGKQRNKWEYTFN